MEEHQGDVDSLISHGREYLETKAELVKLKTVDAISSVSATIASRIGLIVIFSFFIFIISVGLSLLVGDWMGKYYYGFFIVGGAYGLIGIIFYLFRDRWLKSPVNDLIIRELLK